MAASESVFFFFCLFLLLLLSLSSLGRYSDNDYILWLVTRTPKPVRCTSYYRCPRVGKIVVIPGSELGGNWSLSVVLVRTNSNEHVNAQRNWDCG